MKLKILPPTLRTKNRYLALDIKSEFELNKDELVLAIWDACIRFYGEYETSNFNLWLMRLYNMPCPIEERILTESDKISLNNHDTNYKPLSNCFYQKAVLKCRRNCEDKVRSSLATMSNYKGKKIAIATIGISGTVSSLMHKFIN
jgi:ribonuclease P/MRP protein subunit POP5